MYHFTPWAALVGGLLIGLASVLLLLLNGRIAGITGILGGGFSMHVQANLWRWLFLLGLVLGAGGYYVWAGTDVLPSRQGFPVALLVLAGLFTGYGTSLANGCTSGHGVCGMGRLSVRSLVATLTFLLVAIATTYVVRHVVGFAS
jgi:uncharacterized membrane protein YedE/YeeE